MNIPKRPEIQVLASDELKDGATYWLQQLPDSCFFSIDGATYKTITRPKYNILRTGLGARKRSCMNMSTLAEELIPEKSRVIFFRNFRKN